ncbi:GNAT family N-acetyltransferase [Paenibacillus cookii]|uniref:Acetyltransferase n=1 Tax=Paenibacillus cookii TaxID=157839 RepID=A0ABQ4M276_9BACL|nr:GNAT family N-acetyltransferase [Paenibacillus cookii]KHF33783.1 Enhanced intracellular survival protein [Paenibacillus sp. P1XP2]GIO69533.1 acetyltransferase [Paenibacillus cookii]
MEIRTLKPEEFDAAIELGEYAFQYRMTAEAKEKARKRFKPENTWGMFDEEGRLSAKLGLLNADIFVNGKKMPMSGVAGVATWPEYRRQGLVKQLLTHSLQVMNESGKLISMLHPFSFAFYRKFGWEMFSDFKKYVISTEKLPAKQVTEGTVRRGVTDISVLNRVYEAYASRYNGMMVRDEDRWKHAILNDEEDQTAVYYDSAGEPQGFLLYKVQKQEMQVYEFIYLTEEARQALWTFIGNHDSMIKQTVLDHMPVDDGLTYMLADPRITQEIVPFGMARIVNVPGFIEAYAFQSDGKEQAWTVQIQDPYAPWNEGKWRIALSPEGTAAVTAADPAERAQLSLDIQTLTTMMLGYKRPGELLNMGRLAGEPEAVAYLERVIPIGRTFLLDFF